MREALETERHGLWEQRDLLREELDAAVVLEASTRARQEQEQGLRQDQEQALREELEQVADERDSYHVAHDLAVRQRDERDAELQQLREVREKERAEIEGLRERQEELSRLTSESERHLALIRDLFVQVSTARAQPEA